MDGLTGFVDDPVDTREAIMKATYLALLEHGYADLTIQRIGDEFGKSKSLLYHHYDGKDELLLDFLAFMLERFEATLPPEAHDGTDEYLASILDSVLVSPPDADQAGFFRALIELRAQAAHDLASQKHFTRSDQFFRDRLADLIRTGIDEGVFQEVDPEATATFLQTVIVGAMLQDVTTEEAPGPTLRSELDHYVRSRLLADRSP